MSGIVELQMGVNLVLLKKNGLQKVFALPSDTTVIGRRHDCDLCIPLMSVSRRHCQLIYDGKKLKIRDLGSHNGTLVNGQRVEESEVQAGDAIVIGPLAFVTQINGRPEKVRNPDSADEEVQLNGKHELDELGTEFAGEKMAGDIKDDFDVLTDEFFGGGQGGGDAESDPLLHDSFCGEQKA